MLRYNLTILEGDPGLGKSLLTLDLASRVTTGRPMPDGSPGRKGNVILIAPEDGPHNVIRPRVDAAGGDPLRIRLLSHVHTINPMTGNERKPPFTLPEHLPNLAAAIKDTRAVLVIIDPLTAVLPSGINGPGDKSIGKGLIRLAMVARQTGCAILIVHHHNKGSFSNPLLYRSGGSLSLIAMARTGLLVFQHPSDANTCILTTTKNNFTAKASNLIYQVVGNEGGIPTIRWLDTDDTPTASLLKRAQHHLNYSFERQALLKTLQASSTPLSPKELASLTGQNHTLVKQMLRRMVEADEIAYPCYGLYTSHNHPLTVTPFSENTPAIPTTPATLTTLTTPASDPAANLDITPAIPTTPATLTTLTTPASDHAANLDITPAIPTTPTTPATRATLDHPNSNLTNTFAIPTTLTTLSTPASDSAANLASSPAIPTTPTTLTTPATLDRPNSNLTNTTSIPTTPATLTTLTTPASDPASNLDITPAIPTTPTTLTTPATLDHPNSSFALPPTTPEHNTPAGITLSAPPASSIPTSTPPPSFETTIENLRNLLHCSYKDHHLHWIFSTNKAGCPICDTWINNDTNLNPDMRILYDTLAQHPPHPGESNPTWLHRITPLL